MALWVFMHYMRRKRIKFPLEYFMHMERALPRTGNGRLRFFVEVD